MQNFRVPRLRQMKLMFQAFHVGSFQRAQEMQPKLGAPSGSVNLVPVLPALRLGLYAPERVRLGFGRAGRDVRAEDPLVQAQIGVKLTAQIVQKVRGRDALEGEVVEI